MTKMNMDDCDAKNSKHKHVQYIYMSKVSRKYYTDKQEYTIQNNGAMDIGDSPRETVLPTLKHTFNTFSKTIIFNIYNILIFFRKKTQYNLTVNK